VKQLTSENWLEPDVMSVPWMHWAPAAGGMARARLDGGDWVQVFMQPQLSAAVPAEVRNLFEVARAIFMYGYFFYPLYALGTEQLTRVAEAAAKHRCRLAGGPLQVPKNKKPGSPMRPTMFKEHLDWLAANGLLDPAGQAAWSGLPGARNAASHLDDATALPPTIGPQALHRVATLINALFAPAPATTP
jgi:hypothetical protein